MPACKFSCVCKSMCARISSVISASSCSLRKRAQSLARAVLKRFMAWRAAVSIASQGLHRIDSHGSSRGHITGDHGNEHYKQGDPAKGERIGRTDTKQLRRNEAI